jgi:hypothetical protein
MGTWSYSPGDPKDAFIYCAIVSCFLSFLVVLTYAIFPRLQGKLFMKIITLISFCDFVANVSQVNGVPSNRVLCVLQGIAQQFYPASWMWTVILTYLLYSLVVNGKILMPEWQMHLIVWATLVLIIFLPFTTSTYGHDADDTYDSYCWIAPRSYDSEGYLTENIWSYTTFDAILYGSIIIMTILGVIIFYKLRIQQIPRTRTMRSALRTLLRYPVVLFVTWFPNALYLLLYPDVVTENKGWIIVDCLSIWQGGLTAIIFFISSHESRALWANLLTRLVQRCGICRSKGAEEDMDNSLLSVNELLAAVEDFESDDAYYGRNSAGVPQNNRESLVAMSRLHNNDSSIGNSSGTGSEMF